MKGLQPTDIDRTCRAALNCMSAHIAILSVTGEIIWINHAWRRFSTDNGGDATRTGVGNSYLRACEKAVEQKVEGAEAFLSQLKAVLSGDLPESELEYPCHAPWEKRWFFVKVIGLDVSGQKYAVVAHENVTARRALTYLLREIEAQLREAERRSAIAEWVGAIGHEIKNPLTAILLRVELLRKNIIAGNKSQEMLLAFTNQIEKTAKQILGIVSTLTGAFKNSTEKSYEWVNIRSICEDAIEMSKNVLGNTRIELRISKEVENQSIECIKVAVVQILGNLIRNACEALFHTPDPWIAIEVESRAEEILFSVIDNGPGVSASVKAKLFRPNVYPSEKPNGKGTGLGLKLSQTLAQSNGGDLYLDSSSRLTRFVLVLPKRQAVHSLKRVA